MPPHVSVVIPIYNGARFIPEVLHSLECQTWRDWELILIDDGSTDDTAARLAELPSDPRRHIIRQPNQGSAAARNQGLAAAQGEFIAFLDVDDSWQPGFLAEMVAALRAAPTATVAFCGWQYCDINGAPLPQVVQLSPDEARHLDQLLLWRNAIMPASTLARRAALVAAGGFDVTLQACEDWDLWLRLMPLGPFVAVSQVLTWYRAHAASLTEQIARIETEQLKVIAKHLGALDEPLAQWPAMRRQAVGFTYFTVALAYLWQNQRATGVTKARQAVATWTGLLGLDEFYYELGCANQPRGQRGQSAGLDLPAGEALIQEVLRDNPVGLGSATVPSHADLVLARLARNVGLRSDCRRCAWRALRLGNGPDRRQALKLLVWSLTPERVYQGLRRSRRRLGTQPAVLP